MNTNTSHLWSQGSSGLHQESSGDFRVLMENDYYKLLKDWNEVESGWLTGRNPQDIIEEYKRNSQEKIEMIIEYQKKTLKERCETIASHCVWGTREGSSLRKISWIRTIEPDVDKYLEIIFVLIGNLTDQTPEEAMMWNFIELDDIARSALKTELIPGISIDQPTLAEKAGDLLYDHLSVFLKNLSETIKKEAEIAHEIHEDRLYFLDNTQESLNKASENILTAWEICRPYIDEKSLLRHKTEILSEMPNSDLAKKISNLKYQKLSEFLVLLSQKIAKDAKADRERGRKKLSSALFDTAKNLWEASEACRKKEEK